RAYTLLRRAMSVHAAHADDWGQDQIHELEVTTYLDTPFYMRPALAPDACDQIEACKRAVAELELAIAARLKQTDPAVCLRLVRLHEFFHLSRQALDLLLVCLLPELGAHYRRLYHYLQDDPMRTPPTVE